ncbi:hypothetical protein QB910_000103 [Dabrowskivirus KKP3916]|uniref:lysozyme n=1 Tax=Alicyclobacillus phage KKP_3916 TaxID=3040651 RepID=A0AAT9V7N8_9CAUD|nr:hypothetical protein QB910_000103 [Alicyclobacillus phage KKP 3916]
MNFIDVSHYQGTVNMAKVHSAGIKDIGIKVSEGLTIIDPSWQTYYKDAEANGMNTMLYHFGHPSEDPIKQAEFFYNTAKALGLGELPMILDIETNDNNTKIDVDSWSIQFLDHLLSISNHDVGVYSSEWFATTYLPKTLAKYSFHWIAKYSTVAPTLKYAIWQKSQTGHVDGINTPVDIDEGVDSLLADAVTQTEETLFNVVVKDSVYSAFLVNGTTYVLWTALNEYGTPHTYKGNGLMTVNGVDVQGVVYQGDTYLPWTALAENIKPTAVKFLFTV